MLSQYLQIIGLGLDFVGAVLLLIPVFRTEEEVKKETLTVIGGNPYVLSAWKKERQIGIAGLVLLILGFTVQAIAIFTMF